MCVLILSRYVLITILTDYELGLKRPFGVHKIVEKLSIAVLERLQIGTQKSCLIFPSASPTARCAQFIQKHHGLDIETEVVAFYLPETADTGNMQWARFYVLIYHTAAQKSADEFWSIFGDGISSRHAEFCLERWPFMRSESPNRIFRSPAMVTDISLMAAFPWTNEDQNAKEEIKRRIATMIASEQPGFPPVPTSEVFLYQKGMCALSAVARAMIPSDNQTSGAAVYGWPYSETPKCVRQSGYDRFTMYGQGSESELDQLESSLASGERIQVLFCEIPSNPLLRTPDLRRIRDLADRYEFCVVCDETIGTYINVDILPYVDVAVTSLTKIFNGTGNVMGGSVVVNPRSAHRAAIHDRLTAGYEDILFTADAMILAQNSRDLKERVLKCNANALDLANFLAKCPSIDSVYYPTMVPTTRFYEQFRRPTGGYGYLLSVLFKDPDTAVQFYNTLDVRKGPNIGTNFTLVLPYAQLAHYYDCEWAESYGVAKHIVRISVGLESQADLVDRITQALSKVEGHAKPVLGEVQRSKDSLCLDH
ncbi:unnamed protein product [Penicillium salamii]|nr:unnamed protein product [Penicillium salamii]CAG8272676.1 unnamed protein product [Penicillium salamii]